MELRNRQLLREQALIGGQWTDAASGSVFAVNNPATGQKIAQIPNLGETEVAQSVSAAFQAFQHWKTVTASDRCTILQRWYQLIMDHADDLATVMVSEQGKPFAEAKGEVAYAARFVQWFGEQAKRIHGTIMADYAPQMQLQYTREAVGVVGIITPWNFPLAMITRKLAPALAAGCTAVVKPSSLTPLSALAVAYLAERAGVPAGACNVVTSTHSSRVGEVLSRSPQVRKISFTGSTAVGKNLLSQCAAGIKRVSMELGGNAPFIVFEDADLDTTVRAAIASKYRNAGQTCVCANRIFVHTSVHDCFVDMLQAEVEQLVVGNGLDSGVNQGPLINLAAVEKVEEHIKKSVADGATIVTGGSRHALGGTFFQPTILVNVPPTSVFGYEETFGPVAPITAFDSEEQVISWANDTQYGLAAYFCSQNFRRIQRVARDLEAGMVCVNEGILSNEFAPFGGIKESGLGREGSTLGIEEYLEIKYTLTSFA